MLSDDDRPSTDQAPTDGLDRVDEQARTLREQLDRQRRLARGLPEGGSPTTSDRDDDAVGSPPWSEPPFDADLGSVLETKPEAISPSEPPDDERTALHDRGYVVHSQTPEVSPTSRGAFVTDIDPDTIDDPYSVDESGGDTGGYDIGQVVALDPVTTVDAGPFDDLLALRAFERQLGHIPAVREVYVKNFGGERGVVELRLRTPTTILNDLEVYVPQPFRLRAVGGGTVVIDFEHTGEPDQPEARKS